MFGRFGRCTWKLQNDLVLVDVEAQKEKVVNYVDDYRYGDVDVLGIFGELFIPVPVFNS